MIVTIKVLTAPLSEEQIFDLGQQFEKAVQDGVPVTLLCGPDDEHEFVLHPVEIERTE